MLTLIERVMGQGVKPNGARIKVANGYTKSGKVSMKQVARNDSLAPPQTESQLVSFLKNDSTKRITELASTVAETDEAQIDTFLQVSVPTLAAIVVETGVVAPDKKEEKGGKNGKGAKDERGIDKALAGQPAQA